MNAMSPASKTATLKSKPILAFSGSLVLLIALALGYLIITHVAHSAAPAHTAVASAASSASGDDSTALNQPGRVSFKAENTACVVRPVGPYRAVADDNADAVRHLGGQAYYRMVSQSLDC